MATAPKDAKHSPLPITAEETDLNAARTRSLNAQERQRAHDVALPPGTPAPIPYGAVADETTMVDADSGEWPVIKIGPGPACINLHTRGAIKVTVDGKRVPAGRVMVLGLDPNGSYAVVVKGSDGRVRVMEVKMKGRGAVEVTLD